MVYSVPNIAESFLTAFRLTLVWFEPPVYSLMNFQITLLFEAFTTAYMIASKVFELSKMELSVVNIVSVLSREFSPTFFALYLFFLLFLSILDRVI